MKKKLTFKELAYKILEEEKRPLTAEEIWEITKAKQYNNTLINSQGKTPERTIAAQLYVDIRDNPDSPFVKVGTRPVKFFLKKLLQATKNITEESNKHPTYKEKITIKERELHQYLVYFLNTYHNIYLKTIYHERSKKKGYTQWLHPDMVGVYFPIDDWEPEVMNFSKSIGMPPIILYSFELKVELSFSNLRESYFQAVSNSSWANEGYLVAYKIDKSEEFQYELKRLASAFGIGIIELDIDDPDASNILFPAKQKNILDWETINKLSSENIDFKKFIERVYKDLSTNEIRKEFFDTVKSFHTSL